MNCCWPGHGRRRSTRAWWRLSSPDDPWPLLYACDEHIGDVVEEHFDGRASITFVDVGESTPGARYPEGMTAP